MTYSHSYEDPDTGQMVDVYDDDGEEYRNARPRRRRGRGFQGFAEAAGRPHRHGGGTVRPAPRPRDPQGSAMVVRPRTTRDPRAPIGPARPHAVQLADDGEYFAIKKSLIAELAPAAGQVWASLLAPPEPPKATGDHIVDRDNASMHRQALAQHDQNQTRILALTNLAARVARLFL